MSTMLLAGLNLEVFVLGYSVAMLAGAKALSQRGLKGWWFTIATMPIYWLLMSIAAWMSKLNRPESAGSCRGGSVLSETLVIVIIHSMWERRAGFAG